MYNSWACWKCPVLSPCIGLIESKLSWNLICHLSTFSPFLSLCRCLSPFLTHSCFWKVNNNKIHFSSLILTRRVSVWFLFISIPHHTSVTLRSGRDGGVKMTVWRSFCLGFFLFLIASTLGKSTKANSPQLRYLLVLSIFYLHVLPWPELYTSFTLFP